MTRLVLFLAALFSLLSYALYVQQNESKPPELPKHAKVNGHDWNILTVDRMAGPRVATTDCDHHTIRILSNIVSPRERADAIWHELMHALGDCIDTAWNNTGDENDPDDGHTGIYTMTPRILDLFVDNPELIRFIQYEAGQGK